MLLDKQSDCDRPVSGTCGSQWYETCSSGPGFAHLDKSVWCGYIYRSLAGFHSTHRSGEGLSANEHGLPWRPAVPFATASQSGVLGSRSCRGAQSVLSRRPYVPKKGFTFLCFSQANMDQLQGYPKIEWGGGLGGSMEPLAWTPPPPSPQRSSMGRRPFLPPLGAVCETYKTMTGRGLA